MNKLRASIIAGIVALSGIAVPGRDSAKKIAGVDPVVALVKAEVQPEIERHRADQQALVLKELTLGSRVPALFKTPVCVKGLSDPWGGMLDLEGHGLKAAAAARLGLAGLERLIDALSGSIGKGPAETVAIPQKKPASLDEHVQFITAVFDKAKALRDKSLEKISTDERKFLFARPPQLLSHLGPQLPLNDKTRPILQKDRDFCVLAHERIDWPRFAAAARVLAALARPDYLALLKNALEAAAPIKDTVPGVTGDILFKKETPHGLIVFGGKGPNTYDLNGPVAVLVDLGGNDTYRGQIASSWDADHPFSVVIDFAGNDTYECGEFGLATGRLGVGMLFDLDGNDTYKLAPASGGTGFAGIGILCDALGDDVYAGTAFTQGAAVAGIGLLLDLAGDDKYTSFGFALGFGGPGGVGAVIDVAGNDSYQCGKKFPSGYNPSENPKAKPGDPGFQYDCFGMGTGMGRRVFPPSAEGNGYALAGGVGMVIDLAGNDRSESSNFSQACGYFFGVGLKLDLAGDDQHSSARYGMASGAHFGMGLFIDYAGQDTYTSTGPVYTAACSWDHSVFLFIDAAGDDTYLLDRTSGPALADIGAWSVFADMGGKDRYKGGGFGRTSRNSLAVFFDRAGDDDYSALKDPQRNNHKTHKDPSGGLFVDK
jgi:hypothetical protein